MSFIGASSGIGAATAILFSKLGARLALTGRKIESLQETSKLCQEVNGTAEEVQICYCIVMMFLNSASR